MPPWYWVEIPDIEPETGMEWGMEQKPPWTQPASAFHRVSLLIAGNFLSLGAWAEFQLVPWRREVSYPITSLLSQPVPPGLRSYKHQPVLRGDLLRAPPLIPDGEETRGEEQMLTFSFQWAKNNNSTTTKSIAAQMPRANQVIFYPRLREQEVICRELWAESTGLLTLCALEILHHGSTGTRC